MKHWCIKLVLDNWWYKFQQYTVYTRIMYDIISTRNDVKFWQSTARFITAASQSHSTQHSIFLSFCNMACVNIDHRKNIQRLIYQKQYKSISIWMKH